MVTVLAFVVLGGGTALASFVVSSNSQVGPNTISGHRPPAGAHSNLMTRSIGAQDLALNGVNSLAIQNGQVSPLDLNVNTTKATARYNDGPSGISCTFVPPASCSPPPPDLARMNLPKGSYLIFAKTWIEGGGSAHEVVCTLSAEGDTDRTKVFLGAAGTAGHEQSVALNLAHTFDPTGARWP